MRRQVVLITGAAGEIGHGLIRRLSEQAEPPKLVTIDLRPLGGELERLVAQHYTGSILDRALRDRILAEFEVHEIYHLAALLSTRSEFTPVAAHEINVDASLDLLEFARTQGSSHGRAVRFLYPSSIAAYGLDDLEEKRRAGRVSEDAWTKPRTMYGCNKLYCEHVGRYYARYFCQLNPSSREPMVDFRSIRFPGLISSETIPSGGTSDYAPEMLHAAAQGEAYACFVRADTRIPFMAMPDAVEALIRLESAPVEALSRRVYNIAAFNPSAEEIREVVVKSFPRANISYEPDMRRQAIVDSWPEDVDDSCARRDWGFSPRFDFEAAFSEYLIPRIRTRYKTSG